MALITSENARQLADIGRANTKARIQKLRETVDIALKNPALDFNERTLSRVRVQMDSVADEIDKELLRTVPDSKRLKELTDSFDRLSDRERILAGRPLPGSRKPAPERSEKRSSRMADPSPVSEAPVEQPRPVQPEPVKPVMWDYP